MSDMTNLQQKMQELQQSSNNNSSKIDEKFNSKYVIHVGLHQMINSETIFVTLPFGINLELTDNQRKYQLPKSLELMDGLASIASELDEGEGMFLFPVEVGKFNIQLRHKGQGRQASESPETQNALATLRAMVQSRK